MYLNLCHCFQQSLLSFGHKKLINSNNPGLMWSRFWATGPWCPPWVNQNLLFVCLFIYFSASFLCIVWELSLDIVLWPTRHSVTRKNKQMLQIWRPGFSKNFWDEFNINGHVRRARERLLCTWTCSAYTVPLAQLHQLSTCL